jgi:hypothetical protein
MISFVQIALLGAMLAAAAHQSVSDGQLQRWIARGGFPIGCGDATQVANGMRVKPTTDPVALRNAAKTFRACATGPYGLHSSALANASNFAAAAALLLAARYEPAPQQSDADAKGAKALAQTIIDYTRPPNAYAPRANPDPSPLITDAGQIKTDATALLGTRATAMAIQGT